MKKFASCSSSEIQYILNILASNQKRARVEIGASKILNKLIDEDLNASAPYSPKTW